MRFDWKSMIAAVLISGVIFGTAGYFLGSASRGEAYLVSGSSHTAAYLYDPGEDEAEDAAAAEEEADEETAEAAPAEKVNINTADLEELQTLNGIGEVKAQAIIDYREENGSFSTVEDLAEVPGIGEATLADIYDRITTD